MTERRRSDIGKYGMVPAWLVLGGVSSGAVHLFAVLAIRANSGTDECWPSRKTLAKECACSPDTVDRRIAELVAAEALEVEARFDEDKQRSNLYTVMFSDPETRRGGRKDAAGGSRADAAQGGRKDAAQNQTQLGSDPVEPEKERSSADADSLPVSSPDDRGFDLFWEIYPKRNGKKIGKGTTLAKWRKLSLTDRRAAFHAAEHYAAAVDSGQTLAKDPQRFISARWWENWADPPDRSSPAVNEPKGYAGIREYGGLYLDEAEAM